MKRSSWLLVGLSALGLGLLAWFMLGTSRRLPADLLASVPKDAMGVMRIRVDDLVRSPAFERLVVAPGHAHGIARVQQLCGFHPLRGVDEALVFALPGADATKPRVALLARGNIPHLSLLRCIDKLGRTGSADLVRESIEGIDTLRSKNGSTRAAFVGSDGAVAGEAEAVRAALETLVGKRPGLAPDGPLKGLYEEIDKQSELALVASMRGNEALIARALGAAGIQAAAFPTQELTALSASARLDGDVIHARAQLVAASPGRAQAVVNGAERWRQHVLAIPALALTGFSRPLREMTLAAHGSRATLRADLPVKTIATAVELVPALTALERGLRRAPPQARPDAGAAPVGPMADEEDEP